MKDSDRREDKGRHYFLGDRTDSIPRRASYYAKVWFEERVEFILFFISSWCNSSFGPFFILSRCNSSYSLNCPGAKQLALQGIESILSPKPQRRPCPFFYVFLLFLRVLPSICSVGKEGYLQHRTLWFACHICLYRCATTCAGAAGAAEGEAEADRGHHDREDGGGAQARQVHRGQEAARALLREGAHRAHRLW